MNQDALLAAIALHCKELRLSAMYAHLLALCRQAQDGQWSYEVFFYELLVREIQARRDHATQRRLKEAHFPDLKTFDQLNWEALQGISPPKLKELSSCEYVSKAEDIVILGPIGTGKTHLAIALGVEAAKRRVKVRFIRASDLVRQLVEARDERTLGKLHRYYQTVSLLVLDELGFVPFDKAEGELLFNLLSERYEKRSTIVTSNLSFGEWVQVFGSEKLTTALLDRLAHHAHVLTTKGKSFRTMKKMTHPPEAPSSPEQKET